MKSPQNSFVSETKRPNQLSAARAAIGVALLALSAAVPIVAQQGTNAREIPTNHRPQRRVVGYFPQWGTYSGYNVNNLVASGSASVLTQVDYAFAALQNGQCVSSDPWADYQQPFSANLTVNNVADSTAPGAFVGNFHQLQLLKQKYPNLKIVISVGGGSANPNDFSVAAQPSNRAAFVKSCVDLFIKGNFAAGIEQPGIFDGFDIDWEYPLTTTDGTNMTGLLAEFRKQMDAVRPGMTLSIATSAGHWAYQYLDFKGSQPFLDFFGLMAYDFVGPWEDTTGFVAPLSQAKLDPAPANNASAAVNAYLAAGVQPEKIVLGVPFYGYEWTGVPNVDHGLFQAGTPVGSGAGYNTLLPLEQTMPRFRDQTTLAPWLYDGTNFWTFDDPLSLAYKMLYVRSKNLGGAMAWSLNDDLPNGLLIKTVALTLK
jgi:chitinase